MKLITKLAYISILLVVTICAYNINVFADADAYRFRQIPNCFFADSLDSYSALEEYQSVIAGTPTIADTPLGKGFWSSGVADQIYINHTSPYVDGVQKISICADLMLDDYGTQHHVFYHYFSSLYRFLIQIDHLSSLVIRVANNNTGYYTYSNFNSIVPTDTPFHLGVTFDGALAAASRLKVYLNGVDITSGGVISSPLAAALPNIPTKNISIAGGGGAAESWLGWLKNYYMFSRIISPTEMYQIATKTVFVYPAYEIAYYDMSNKNPSDISYSGNGHNGTSVKCDPVSGWIGSGLSFDGDESLINLGSDWISDSACSISAWIYPITIGEGAGGVILTNDKLILRLQNGTPHLLFTSDGATNVQSANDSIELGRWQHILVTRSAAGLTNFYINGVLSGTADQNSGVPTGVGAGDIIIGNFSDESACFYGTIDEVHIYNIELSRIQAESIYAEGRQ